jgi:hypothetical protein
MASFRSVKGSLGLLMQKQILQLNKGTPAGKSPLGDLGAGWQFS